MQTTFSVSSSESPIFIIGAHRSGTTLLRSMLANHPDLWITTETPFFSNLESKYGSVPDLHNQIDLFLDDLYTDGKFQWWPVDREILCNNLNRADSLNYAQAVAIVHKTYMWQVAPNARIWGHKNPAFIFYIPRVLTYFPKARFVHIVRDVRGVYNSVKVKAITQFGKHLRSPVFLTTKRWSQSVKVIRNYQDDNRFYTIYYESLVFQPQRQSKALCDWLEIDFNDAMLRFYDENVKREFLPTDKGKWNPLIFKPVTTKRIGAWQNELSLSEIEALEILNGKNMQQLGYEYFTIPWRYRGLLRLLREILALMSPGRYRGLLNILSTRIKLLKQR